MNSEPQFERGELGRILLKIQVACSSCSQKKGGNTCQLKSKCAIWMSDQIIGIYLRDGVRIASEVEIANLPGIPAGVEVNADSLEKVLPLISDLCNRCMFHADKCFLNLVFHLLERTLGRPNPKPIGKRPGD